MPWYSKSTKKPTEHKFITAEYKSQQVELPKWFLNGPPPPSLNIKRIDFSETPIPEYAGLYAVVIDDAFTADECAMLVKMAEASADGHGGWRPALVNAGQTIEVLATDYRNSDRIIWDNAELMGRIWERCLCADGLRDELAVVEGNQAILGRNGDMQKWVFTRANERMRFLRYGKGQFFAAHCDSPYQVQHPSKIERTLFTIQVYLNDDGVQGGATTFWSNDEKRKLDVEPRRGRVLVFQHRGLLHTGSEVKKNLKYTMRSDLLYELVENKKHGSAQ